MTVFTFNNPFSAMYDCPTSPQRSATDEKSFIETTYPFSESFAALSINQHEQESGSITSSQANELGDRAKDLDLRHMNARSGIRLQGSPSSAGGQLKPRRNVSDSGFVTAMRGTIEGSVQRFSPSTRTSSFNTRFLVICTPWILSKKGSRMRGSGT